MIILPRRFRIDWFSKCFLSSLKRKACTSNSCRLNGALEKLRCSDGVVWMEGVIGDTKLRFQSLPAQLRTGPKDL